MKHLLSLCLVAFAMLVAQSLAAQWAPFGPKHQRYHHFSHIIPCGDSIYAVSPHDRAIYSSADKGLTWVYYSDDQSYEVYDNTRTKCFQGLYQITKYGAIWINDQPSCSLANASYYVQHDSLLMAVGDGSYTSSAGCNWVLRNPQWQTFDKAESPLPGVAILESFGFLTISTDTLKTFSNLWTSYVQSWTCLDSFILIWDESNLHVTSNLGQTLTTMNVPVSGDAQLCMWNTPGGPMMGIIGRDGFFTSSDTGSSWQQDTSLFFSFSYDALYHGLQHAVVEDSIILIGIDQGMMRSEDYGLSWHLVGFPITQAYYQMAATAHQVILSSGNHLHFGDGTTWNIGNHAYDNISNIYALDSSVWVQDNQGLHQLNADGRMSQHIISTTFTSSFAGHEGLMVFGPATNLSVSIDSGQTWQPLNPAIQGVISKIRIFDEGIYILTRNTASDATLFVTQDTGQSWTTLTIPAYDCRDIAVSGNEWFVQTGSNGIIWSGDGGSNWQDITYGIFSNRHGAGRLYRKGHRLIHMNDHIHLRHDNQWVKQPVPFHGGYVQGMAFSGDKWYISLRTVDANLADTHHVWVADTALISSLVPHPHRTEDLAVFPNPAQTQFSLGGLEHGGTLHVYNAMGQVMFQAAARPQMHVAVSGWPKGVYTLRYSHEGRDKFGKLSVLR